MITLRVIGDWKSIVGEKLANDFLLAFCETSQLWTVNRYVKLQPDLVFRLADDLNKLLQSPCNVVSIWELTVLIVNLFSRVEAELAVKSHGLIVCIAILVGSDEKVNVVTESPPDRGALPVEDRGWKEVEQIISSLELFHNQCVLLCLVLLHVALLLLLVRFNQSLDSMKELETLRPWSSSLSNQLTPVLGWALNIIVVVFLVNQVKKEVLQFVLLGLQVLEECSDKVIGKCFHLGVVFVLEDFALAGAETSDFDPSSIPIDEHVLL